MLLRAIVRAGPALHARLAHDLGTGVSDAVALDQIMASRSEDLGVVELARRIGLRSASTTAAVDRLVASGHLVRTPHASDGRRTVLQATPSAFEDGWRVAGPLISLLRDAAADLDDDEARIVIGYLTKAMGAIDAYLRDGDRDHPGGSTPAGRP